MTIIDLKLIDAYTVLVLADKYILKEEERVNEGQKLVPEKYINQVEVKVAERIVDTLEGGLDES